MTKEEFMVIAAGLRETYRRDKLLDTRDAFGVWYELLKDLDYQTASAAAQAYCATEHFPPVPADIRKKAAELSSMASGGEMSEGEAWALVMRAVSNGIYGFMDEYERLPEDIQKALGSPQQLRTWAMQQDFKEEVVQALFLRSYRAVVARKKQEALLPKDLRERIGLIGKNLGPLLDNKNNYVEVGE